MYLWGAAESEMRRWQKCLQWVRLQGKNAVVETFYFESLCFSYFKGLVCLPELSSPCSGHFRRGEQLKLPQIPLNNSLLLRRLPTPSPCKHHVKWIVRVCAVRLFALISHKQHETRKNNLFTFFEIGFSNVWLFQCGRFSGPKNGVVEELYVFAVFFCYFFLRFFFVVSSIFI